MISKLKIENFKSIEEMEMRCSAINLLIGPNSSGKSTVIQGVLFAGQNMESECGLNGTWLSLGSFEESRCAYTRNKVISVALEDENGNAINVRLGQAETLKIEEKQSGSKKAINKALDFKARNLQYLSCHRVGPQNVYSKNMAMEDLIGTDGEYAIAFLNKHGAKQLDKQLCKGDTDYTLSGQVNWWLSYIVNTEISTEEISGADLIKASYTMNEVSKIRPLNIGSGISYLISILIMCLSSPDCGIVIIENPEIHLHPSAQAKLCEFFYFVAESGRQLFIESHSDHIFNGFRAGIATEEMNRELVNIEFISLNEEHVSECMKVEIGRMGRIENQREDLFDQFDIDLNKMIGLRRKKNGVDISLIQFHC